MHHLILGYGYCGYYLAQELLSQQQKVTALSRHLNPDLALSGLHHLAFDLNQPFNWEDPDTIIHYLIPPDNEGQEDTFLKHFLAHSSIRAKKILYFGSSGVYGNHHGAWVNEESSCFINNNRQKRRLDAEHQWLRFSEQNNIEPIIMRVAGIFGPHRLPIEAAKTKSPLIEKKQAPFTNSIYVKDLVSIAVKLSQKKTPYNVYNIADGEPRRMGSLQQMVAKTLEISEAPYEELEQIWSKASPMKREFIQSSKRLLINRLRETLGSALTITPLNKAIASSLK